MVWGGGGEHDTAMTSDPRCQSIAGQTVPVYCTSPDQTVLSSLPLCSIFTGRHGNGPRVYTVVANKNTPLSTLPPTPLSSLYPRLIPASFKLHRGNFLSLDFLRSFCRSVFYFSVPLARCCRYLVGVLVFLRYLFTLRRFIVYVYIKRPVLFIF